MSLLRMQTGLDRNLPIGKPALHPKPCWVEEFKFLASKVTVEDISSGRAPRPRILDMFAGGGAIPLEALRLGCEATALDLNPVAHIIQMCTLVFPQMYGKPDPNSRGMTGSKDGEGKTTWGGLSNEVRYWGKWILREVRSDIGNLYPPIPDPRNKGRKRARQADSFNEDDLDQAPMATCCLLIISGPELSNARILPAERRCLFSDKHGFARRRRPVALSL
jgi:hypothetical protein